MKTRCSLTAVTLAILLLSLGIASPCRAEGPSLPSFHGTGPYPYGEHDYRFTTLEEVWLRDAVDQVSWPCIDCSQEVQYTSFAQDVFFLKEFRGKNVRVLLPDVWIQGLTEDERRTLIDRSDWLYEHFKEIMGEEPLGPGLLTIAMVDPTCGFGCGYVGYKGIEIAGDAGALDWVRGELTAGFVPGVIVHEMTHNFDVFCGYLHYLPDHAHAWTDFFSHYISVYDRQGKLEMPPDAFLASMVRSNYLPYYENQEATWEMCVRDGLCEADGISRNYTWGGILLRFAQLHGPEAVRRYMGFLHDFKSTEQPPTGAEAREDLNVAAMAAGARLNLGCYVDAWRWHASEALRASMAATYGSGNVFCADADGDMFSILQGDCDDYDSKIRPDALEVLNGLDDDCTSVVDDIVYHEPTPGDFQTVLPVHIPSIIHGAIQDGDGDYFTFMLTSPGYVYFRLCSDPDFQGWLFLYEANGDWYDYQWVYNGTCSERIYYLNEAREWKFGIELNTWSIPGTYSVNFFKTQAWPGTWGNVIPDECLVGGYALGSNTTSPSYACDYPTSVRYWVSGCGFVASVPYSEDTAFNWFPSNDLMDGIYGYRAQLFKGITPVSDATSPLWLDVETLDQAQLSSPANNQTNVSPSVSFDWSDVAGASAYDIQVCDDGDCASLVRSASIPSSAWAVNPILESGKTYYWRTRGKRLCGVGKWSEVFSFQTSSVLDADFTGTPLMGKAPLSVQFTDASSGNVTAWSWAFGDGGTSSLQNPGHTYNAAGTYTVSLTVTGPGGSNTETRAGYITVTGSDCVAEQVLHDHMGKEPDRAAGILASLRAFRDALQASGPEGQDLVAMYARHQEEVSQRLRKDPELAASLAAFIIQAAEAVKMRPDMAEFVIPNPLLRSLDGIIVTLQSTASAKLKEDLQKLRAYVEAHGRGVRADGTGSRAQTR